MAVRRGFILKILAVVLGSMLIGLFGVKMHMEGKIRQSARRAADSVRPTALFEYRDEDLVIDLWRQALRLDNLRVVPAGGAPVRLDRLLVRDADLEHSVPHRLDLSAEGLRLEGAGPGLDPLAAGLLAQGGNRTGRLDLAYEYHPQDRVLDIRELSVEAPGLGRARLALGLGNVDLEAAGLWKNFTSSIRGAELDLAAAPDRAASGPLPAAWTAELEHWRAKAERDGNARALAALEGLKRFAEQPGRLKATARPKEPVPILYFFMGRDLPDILGLLRVEVQAG